ncbi:TetR/AcrR family transcriptional regulator [Clostridium neonatale]|uniref:TetR/AcrR family transcriptional regulator n=1 Tax=Clostridium neonatale TaxID=137838 RepID=UPI00291BD157|nr:TetR/AcrR family transcriptional regulator [Clostridium neonatale]CAI3643865.1 putative transcriptional regulator, TetR-type [Clostridium neonatale]
MSERECPISVKERIINIALEEFAQNGYQSASTNVICKKAKVSKGLLYHYYGSKENLYLSVLRYFIDKFKENITIYIEESNKKGIDYISEYFNAKFKFFGENPQYSKLVLNLLLNNNIEGAEILANEFEEYNNVLLYEIIKNIDFNPKFNRNKAFELIVMIGSKLEEKHMKDIESKDKHIVIEEFRKDHKIMLEMVFEGIDK